MPIYRDPLHASFDPFFGVRRGIEARILYNNLLMNDRRAVDQYRVQEINGLDDADMRDDRQENPDRHGETGFTALYGGRTVTLRGEVKAGNLAMLHKMSTDLLGAFWDLTQERELSFLYLDYYEDFSKLGVLSDFTLDTGAVTVNTALRKFIGTAGANNIFWHNIRSYIDHFVGLKYTVGTGAASGSTFCMLKRLDTTNYLYCGVSNPGTLQINKLDVNSAVTLATVTLPTSIIAGNTYWVRAFINGNDITVEHWSEEPTDAGQANTTLRHTLVGANATKFGTGVSGRAGVRFNPPDANWSFTNFDLRSLNPGDPMIICRKSGKTELVDNHDNKVIKAPFLLTLRSSDHRVLSRYPVKKNVNPILVALAFPAANGFTFPPTGEGIQFSTDLVTITNFGTATANPIIRITGTIVNPAIGNSTTNQVISLLTTITAPDFYDIDVAKRRITDSFGNSQYGKLADTYDWVELAPGDNDIGIGADSQTSSAVQLIYRHSW